ncbi:hypothetical protein H1P_220044 [Hyella patelloides LEGE 07179]|uniref:TIR domain-containing protein n=1 Tax=Hyella patelloides LEGE 07179 TaxID=945734 RepID=A0A563VQV2_9CYAN|nr:hypothetical protein [Hyella patelloides]VEP13803.1 hypothetical protein H1P_220044 [Hyella patelloides LEGE 07179]
MNKMTICIVCESILKSIAQKLKKKLEIKYQITIYTKAYFPTGDAMLPFLYTLSEKFDIAFILISNSVNSSVWISKELKVQHHSLNSCKNIYPVFLTKADVPSWWNDDRLNFFTFDSWEKDDIEQLL